MAGDLTAGAEADSALRKAAIEQPELLWELPSYERARSFPGTPECPPSRPLDFGHRSPALSAGPCTAVAFLPTEEAYRLSQVILAEDNQYV